MDGLTDSQLKVLGLLPFLGVAVAGDIDGLTVWTTRRGKIVAMVKSPPEKPPSALQILQRERFAASMRDYKQRSESDRKEFERLTNVLGLCQNGVSLYIHLSLNSDDTAWSSIVAKTGTTVSPPTRF